METGKRPYLCTHASVSCNQHDVVKGPVSTMSSINIARIKSTRPCVRCHCTSARLTSRNYCPTCNHLWLKDRAVARRWARAQFCGLSKQQDWVILDTETTGLHATAQIVEIAILDRDGTVLVDSLVRPSIPIPTDATRIHNITNAMVVNVPTFADLYPTIRYYLRNHTVVVYNASYDHSIIAYELHRSRLPEPQDCRWGCAMLWYAKFTGEWNSAYSNYRWHKLAGGDHTALGDCRATLQLMQEMARDTADTISFMTDSATTIT